MKIAVTGASGHVGGNLVRALLDEGHEVKVLVRNDTRAIEGLEVERVKGHLHSQRALFDLVRKTDVVYHLAARISLDGARGGEVHEANVDGTRNVVDACLEGKTGRLVHFSSIHAICQHPRDTAVDESRPLADEGPCHAYDRTKAAGERAVREGVSRGLDAVIVNPTGILGPHDYKPSAMGQVLLDLFNGAFPALVEGGFNWVDVRDVVQGAMAAARKGRKGERYLLSGHYLTLREMAAIVQEVSGRKPPRFVSPTWLALVGAPLVTAWNRLRGTRPLYTTESIKTLEWNKNIVCRKAEAELGYTRRPARETIRDTYLWFKAAGMTV
jgi:dihydroflavonol-4-reductase